MFILSPVATVCQVLQQTQANAETHARIFQKNEAATRAALIDPVLRALGWDTTNVRMVEPEKTLSNELRIDYLLHDSAGKPWAVVEAKCLGSSLDKYGYVGKILGYAITLNVQTVCITDGVTWHLHTHLQHGKPEPIVLALVNEGLLAAANALLQQLDAAQAGHGLHVFAPCELAGSEQNVTAAARNASPVTERTAGKPELSQVAEAADFTDLSKVRLLSLPPGQKPKKLRLPNGTVKPIAIWKDILLEVCYFVLSTNARITLPLPDKAGKKRFLFSSTKPETGSSTQTTYRGQPVFIGTHYSAADCIANAIYALSQLPAGHKSASLAVSF